MPEAIKKYILVTKPGIIFGNLVTASGGFLLASKGRMNIAALLPTIIGISLVVASGCVFNNIIDRNIDRKMARTRNRVLAQGVMSVKAALFYASLLGMAGMTLLWAQTNLMCIAVVLSGFVIYVVVYSLYLKRHSVHSALIGSLAGAAPPLAGYCAAGNRFDMGALIILSIFSLWQMPHCYAIAIYRFKDYAAAGIPVLPVHQGMPSAKRYIVAYILVFMAAAMMLTAGGYTGYIYLAAAVVTGFFWLLMACSGFKTSDDRAWAKKVFVFSILTIAVLSVMMATDSTMPPASHLLLTAVQ
jgi:protoheme IX farnesyltransferase